MEEELNSLSVLHNRKGNVGYGQCSKYLAYSIDSQLVGLGTQGLVVESFFQIGSWPHSTRKSRWSSAFSANLQAGGNLAKLHLIKDRSSHPEVFCK